MKVIVIKPGEKPVVKEIENSLDSLKAEVGGYLEGLRFTDGAYVYIDEYGKEKGLPCNDLATQLCGKYEVGLAPEDGICGTFIIVGTLNEQGQHDCDDHDVPDLLAEQILKESEKILNE